MKFHQSLKLFIIIAVALLATACSEQKKLIKAEQRVLTNPSSFNYIGGKWAKLNPCVIDSVIKYSSGETTKTDTFYNHGDYVYAPAIHDTILIRRYVNRYDTARVYIRDVRLEGILKDSVEYYQLENSKNQTAAEIAKSDANKRSKMVIFWIVVLVIENVAIILYKAKTL